MRYWYTLLFLFDATGGVIHFPKGDHLKMGLKILIYLLLLLEHIFLCITYQCLHNIVFSIKSIRFIIVSCFVKLSRVTDVSVNLLWNLIFGILCS